MGGTSTYGYDQFNRLTSQSGTQSMAWTYDRWGNRWTQTLTGGSPAQQPSFTFSNANNQIASGTCNPVTWNQYCYDAAGNMTADTNHTYTYDAEGNITQVDGGSTATYVYDALNHRVRTVNSSGTTEFVFNLNGQRVSEWNASTHAQLKGHYYWGAKPVAYYTTANDGTAAVHFEHQDWLGTERMRTNASGGSEATFTSLPWGDSQTTASGTDVDAYHYATLDYDSETNTDHAEFRQYSPTQGRFMSPDPYGGSYDMTNPQSFNRYVYAMNNPLSNIDPTGQQDAAQEAWGFEGGGGCTIDSAESSCFMMYNSLGGAGDIPGAGGLAPCPPRGCGTTAIDGVFVYFKAYQTGSTYVPFAGPGSMFSTNDQAIIAGALYAENQSLLTDGNEQCGMAYSADGQFSYTATQHGSSAGCQPLSTYGDIPIGDLATGGYHSHGTYDPAYANDRFSQPGDTDAYGNPITGDVGWSSNNHLPFSVATPGGNVIVYYPGPACQTFFLGGPIGTGTTIPICH